MPSEITTEQLELLRRCLTERASAADYDRAEQILDDHPSVVAQLRAELGFESLLRSALHEDDPAAFAQRIASRIRDRGNSRHFARAMRQRVTSAKRSRRRHLAWPAITGLAAALAVTVLGLLFLDPSPVASASGRVLGLSGEVTIQRQGSKISLDQGHAQGLALQIADTIQLGSSSAAQLLLADGTDVALSGPGRFTLSAPARLQLDQGAADFTVPPRSLGSPLLVDTPQARIEVLGTRFTVAVDQRSRVTVESGQVRLLDRATWSLRELSAGSSAHSPIGTRVLFSEDWDQGLGQWQTVDATNQPTNEDALAKGFAVQGEVLRIPAGAAPHLLSPFEWPVTTGRHLITTRFLFEPSAQGTHHLVPLAIMLRGPSLRFPESEEVPKPNITAGRWYRLAITVDPQPQADGGWIIEAHVVLAPADEPAASPFITSKRLWQLNQASSQHALLFMLRGDIEALRLAAVRVQRLDDDSL